MITEKIVFTTSDGKEWCTRQDAEKHSKKLNTRHNSLYTRYTSNSYEGTKLLQKHSLEQYGVWEVYGEDPNCDLGGSHYQPNLGKVECTLEKAIHWAVEQPGFWQWGGGGSIRRSDFENVIKL